MKVAIAQRGVNSVVQLNSTDFRVEQLQYTSTAYLTLKGERDSLLALRVYSTLYRYR